MATKRMFSMDVIDTDMFLEMPATSQLLYFHMALRADDDGFVSSPKRILRMVGCSEDDMRLLFAKSYLIPFDSGVCVIRHWRIHNYIRVDRYKETIYTREKEMLIEDDSKAYKLLSDIPKGIPSDIPSDIPKGIPSDNLSAHPDKSSIDKSSIDKKSSRNSEVLEETKRIVSYLNSVAGTNFRHQSKATQASVNARLNEGYTYDDFVVVIDKKHAQWSKDSRMAPYIRPQTLFGTKFEAYLNEKASAGGGGGKEGYGLKVDLYDSEV